MKSHSRPNCDALRTRLYEKLARIAHVLGAPARLRILQILAQSPRTVEEISQLCGESVANTSQHLQKMAQENLVFATRHGLQRIYEVSSPEVIAIWETLQDLGHTLSPELDECENKIVQAELKSPLPTEDVLQEVRDRKAILVDVRPEKEIQATPVQGAVTLPLDQLKSAISSLEKGKTIYVFCRGKYCDLASQAVEKLRAAGLQAFRLRESPFRLKLLGASKTKKK